MPIVARRHPAMNTRFRLRLVTGEEKRRHNLNQVWSEVKLGLGQVRNHFLFYYLCSLQISSGAGALGRQSDVQSGWQPLSSRGDGGCGDRSATWSSCIPSSTWCWGSPPHTSWPNSWCTPECNETKDAVKSPQARGQASVSPCPRLLFVSVKQCMVIFELVMIKK